MVQRVPAPPSTSQHLPAPSSTSQHLPARPSTPQRAPQPAWLALQQPLPAVCCCATQRDTTRETSLETFVGAGADLEDRLEQFPPEESTVDGDDIIVLTFSRPYNNYQQLWWVGGMRRSLLNSLREGMRRVPKNI